MSKVYNTTQLHIAKTLERHVYHRDVFSHILRWSHLAREFRHRLQDRPTVVDFGCGTGDLYEVAYRNRTAPAGYVGLDIRDSVIESNRERFDADNVGWYSQDLIHPTMDLSAFAADLVVSLEVIEHVGKQNAQVFLENLKACGNESATYFLSTPNYDGKNAAGNHTYDSGDGRGVAVQEFTYDELESEIRQAGLVVERTFGTFASIRDYKDYLETDPAAGEIFSRLREYYDSELTSVFMAPLVPARLCRNVLWVLKRS